MGVVLSVRKAPDCGLPGQVGQDVLHLVGGIMVKAMTDRLPGRSMALVDRLSSRKLVATW